MKQISIDWDFIFTSNGEFTNLNEYILSKIRMMPYWYKVKSVKHRISSSGSGLHILIDLCNDVSEIDSLLIRAVMNDDHKRLRLDMIRYLYATREIGLIFSEKVNVATGEKKTAGEWHDIELEK